jgi:hypothetical protein
MARHIERVDLCQRIPPGPLPPTAGILLRRDLAQQRLIRTAVESNCSDIRVTRETRVLLESDGIGPSSLDLFAIGLGLSSRITGPLTRAAFMAWRMAW